VKRRSWLPWLAAALVGALAVAGAGYGASKSSKAPAKKSASLKVAVVTDIGGLNDKGFNHLANVGLQRAEKKLKVEGRIFITAAAADRLPNLRSAAQQGYGLVIGVGFLMFDPLGKVAPAFSKTKFAGVDVPWAAVEGKPKNLRGIQFKEQQAGYLVGYIAGLTLKYQGGKQMASAVGANKVPAIVRYIAGYKAGVKKANPKATVLSDYANDPTFADQAKCKETALNQIGRGSKVVFQVAGQCGLGALDAAKSKKVWGIGVDADQSFYGTHILTSAVKKVDVSVYQTIQAYKKNPSKFKMGYDAAFDVRNKGVGYGKISAKAPKRAQIIKAVNKIEKQIASGKIVPPAS
jgi:basic membrane protein A and related proteins